LKQILGHLENDSLQRQQQQQKTCVATKVFLGNNIAYNSSILMSSFYNEICCTGERLLQWGRRKKQYNCFYRIFLGALLQASAEACLHRWR
jgi:hypothetical protein